jgi:hypothetical protein
MGGINSATEQALLIFLLTVLNRVLVAADKSPTLLWNQFHRSEPGHLLAEFHKLKTRNPGFALPMP